ncbi:TPA: hypothetical protein N0F65_005944 [Lagenidium giganteum]|uniref:Uncharacterized protein n=1 Tax=Lagenidium giganteum TaxID=4803 RepID=A0AAV2Z863_9STRA|nr:TPA: hypothetical protein N0F65_005944 [Lagenidium giganteum]
MTPLLSSVNRINAALETGTASTADRDTRIQSFDSIILNGFLTRKRFTSSSLPTLHTKITFNSQGPHWCPDLSYGPREDTPHSVLPPNIPIFADFRTITVEIGVSQQWGMAPGELDHKELSTCCV